MRVLISGCGYVGLATGAQLACGGHEVYGLRRSRDNEEELRAAGVKPLVGDVTEPASLAQIAPAFDWVVNCVSASGGGVDEYRHIYLQGTRNLLAWLKAGPLRKFVYTSSTGVYLTDDGSIVDENSSNLAESGTGGVLVQTEQLLLDAARQSSFPAVILRVAGIYGPGRGYWVRQFLSGNATLEGDGSRRLNMIHRDDVAGAIVTALDRGQPGRLYNAVDNAPPTQREVFEWLAARLKRPMPMVPTPGVGAETSRRRGATNKLVSNQRLREELGWEPRYPTFREGYEFELRNGA